jgi:hypothetical protein
MKAKKNLIVIGDRVLVELDEIRERTTTGYTCRYGQGKGKGCSAVI